MSESESQAHRQALPVINTSSKVEQLRSQPPAPAPPHAPDSTLVDRFIDATKTPKQKAIVEKVIDVLRSIYDPEIPINIYDLGLIYDIDVNETTSAVKIKMTLTAPGCPVAGSLVAEVEKRVENLSAVPSADVELVWDPPWSKERISEAARLELGLI